MASIDNPLDGHTPHVGRVRTGTGRFGGATYGTTLRCSCGWVPHAEGRYEEDRVKVSNEAKSRGGMSAAREQYRAHIAAIGAS